MQITMFNRLLVEFTVARLFGWLGEEDWRLLGDTAFDGDITADEANTLGALFFR